MPKTTRDILMYGDQFWCNTRKQIQVPGVGSTLHIVVVLVCFGLAAVFPPVLVSFCVMGGD